MTAPDDERVTPTPAADQIWTRGSGRVHVLGTIHTRIGTIVIWLWAGFAGGQPCAEHIVEFLERSTAMSSDPLADVCTVCERPLGEAEPHELDDELLCHPDCCPTCQADRDLNAAKHEFWP